MSPDDVRLTAQLVAAGRVHCVSDAATLAMARRVLELEAVAVERDMAQRAAAHWEGVAAANALDVVMEVSAERDACAKAAESIEAQFLSRETAACAPDRRRYSYQASAAADVAVEIRARGGPVAHEGSPTLREPEE